MNNELASSIFPPGPSQTVPDKQWKVRRSLVSDFRSGQQPDYQKKDRLVISLNHLLINQ